MAAGSRSGTCISKADPDPGRPSQYRSMRIRICWTVIFIRHALGDGASGAHKQADQEQHADPAAGRGAAAPVPGPGRHLLRDQLHHHLHQDGVPPPLSPAPDGAGAQCSRWH